MIWSGQGQIGQGGDLLLTVVFIMMGFLVGFILARIVMAIKRRK